MKKKSRRSVLFIALILNVFSFTIIAAPSASSAKNGQTASDFYRQGIEKQQFGEYYEALEFFQQALMLNPTYGDAWYHLAECSYYLDKFEMALQYADNAEKYAKDDADIQNLRGMSYISLGNFAKAREIFEKIISAYPNNIESRFGLAELDLFSGRLGDAESLYRDALKRQETNRKALLSLSLIAWEEGKTDLAKNYINQALLYHSGNAEVYYLASYLAVQEGNLDEAEYKVRSAVQINPDFSQAYELLADILFLEGKYTESIDVCDFIIDKDNTNSKMWYLKGLCFEKQNKDEQAISVWENGLMLNPQDEVMRSAMEILAGKVVSLEDPRRAQWSAWHIEKAKGYEKSFQGSAMRFEYQRALKLSPFNSEARNSYASQLLREGLYELYLEQLKFIKTGLENESQTVPVELNDTIEAYDALLKNTLASKWNVNPLYLDKTRWKLGIYYAQNDSKIQYVESDRICSEYLCEMFTGISSASVQVRAHPVADYAEAFRSARFIGLDYFILVSLDETSRELVVNAKMYSASSGNESASYSVFRAGNDRYSICLRLLRQKILESLSVRGKVIARNGNTLLVDLGKTEGVQKDFVFDVLKKGALRTTDSGLGVSYTENSVLGTAQVTEAGEEISEVLFTQKGFFDRLNTGDEVILTNTGNEKADVPSQEAGSETVAETAPAATGKGKKAGKKVKTEESTQVTPEELGLTKTPALIELIRNIRNVD